MGADTRSHESLSRTNHCGANNNKLYATIYPLQSVLWIVKNGYRSERQRKLSGVKDDLSLVASEVNTSGRLNGNRYTRYRLNEEVFGNRFSCSVVFQQT